MDSWRKDLASALRRLEISIPHVGRLPSVVICAGKLEQIADARIGEFLTVRGKKIRLEIPGATRPFRLVGFTFDSPSVADLSPLLLEMSYCLDEISHPVVEAEWASAKCIVPTPSESELGLPIGVDQWLLATHRFARTLPQTHVIRVYDGQPSDWNEHEDLATLVEDTATTSARFADWLLTTKEVANAINPGECPVRLADESEPPIVCGHRLSKPLSGDQYAVMSELIAVFPKGLSEKEFSIRERTKNINSPRHVLMGLMGERTRAGQGKRETPWGAVIVKPGATGLGWRLKGIT
jgi:hypothetical protein